MISLGRNYLHIQFTAISAPISSEAKAIATHCIHCYIFEPITVNRAVIDISKPNLIHVLEANLCKKRLQIDVTVYKNTDFNLKITFHGVLIPGA